MTVVQNHIPNDRHQFERGSALVEYMFIAALIVIPLLVCIHLLEQESSSVIVEGGSRAGTPAEYSEGVVVPP